MNPETHPRLCAGLVILPTVGGLLIEGGPRRQVLTGGAASSVLPMMLPLLDGEHTLPQLAAALDLPAGHVRRAVSLLDQCDLLEDGPARQPLAGPDTAASLSRHVNVTKVWRDSGALGAALAESAVLLIAPPRLARLVRDDLRAAGVGQVECVSRPESVGLPDVRAIASAVRGIAVLMEELGDAAPPGYVEGICRDQGVAMLRCAVRGDRVEIGPLFYHDYTACYPCFRRGYEALAEYSPVREPPSGPETGTEWLGAGLVIAEILALLGQVTAMRSFRMLTVTSVPGLDSSRFVVVPDADCPVCGSGDIVADGSAGLADAYEWLVQTPPPGLWPRTEVVPRPGMEDLQTQRPDFPTSPSRPLPAPAVISPPAGAMGFGLAPAANQGAIDEATIAGILLRVAGQRDPERSRRWAPTGGNLASVEAYLVAEPSIFPDLPGSIYRYDDIGHRLTAIRRSTISLAECLAGTGLTTPPVRLAIVLVVGVRRISQKYDVFAYRLAHLDAGCATAQLAAVCRGYGLTVSFAAAWDERLADLLELYPGGEIITSVAGIVEPEGQPCP